MRIGRPLPVASRSLAGQSAPERRAAGEVGCAPHDLSLCPRGCKIRSMMKGSMMFPRNGTDASGRRCEMSVNAGCIRISPLCDTDPCLARRPDSGSGLRRLRRILSAFCPPLRFLCRSSRIGRRPVRSVVACGPENGRAVFRPGGNDRSGRRMRSFSTFSRTFPYSATVPGLGRLLSVRCDRGGDSSASCGSLRFAAVRQGSAYRGRPRLVALLNGLL